MPEDLLTWAGGLVALLTSMGVGTGAKVIWDRYTKTQDAAQERVEAKDEQLVELLKEQVADKEARILRLEHKLDKAKGVAKSAHSMTGTWLVGATKPDADADADAEAAARSERLDALRRQMQTLADEIDGLDDEDTAA